MSASTYQRQLDRLSCEAEFLRRELARCLEEGSDASDVHEKLDALRCRRADLAMAEHGYEWDAACIDLDASMRRAMASSVQGATGLSQ